MLVCSASMIQRVSLDGAVQVTRMAKQQEVRASLFYRVNGMLYLALGNQILLLDKEGQMAG